MRLLKGLLGFLLVCGIYVSLPDLQSTKDRIFSRKDDFVMLTNEAGNSGGSGFAIIAKSGKLYTLTNAHVCDGVKDAEGYVYGHDAESENRTVKLKVLEISDFTDLCLLEPMPKAKGFEMASYAPKIFDKAFVVGFPALEPLQPSEGILLRPIGIEVVENKPVSECTQEKERVVTQTIDFLGLRISQDFCVMHLVAYSSTIKIFSGNSGSPVFNAGGDVIGVVFAAGLPNNSMIVRLDDIVRFLAIR